MNFSHNAVWHVVKEAGISDWESRPGGVWLREQGTCCRNRYDFYHSGPLNRLGSKVLYSNFSGHNRLLGIFVKPGPVSTILVLSLEVEKPKSQVVWLLA